MKFKLAYSGYNVVEVEADNVEEAKDKFFDDGLNDLYNAEIEEVVPANEAFVMFTDLNE